MSQRQKPTRTNGDAPAHEAADVERARLAAIVDSSEDAIISKTLDGTVTSWNAAAEKLYGYAAGEAVGRHISFIVPEELRAQLEGIHERLGRGEKINDLETVRVRRDGARVEVALSISPIRNAAGEIVGAATIARDIGQRRRAEAERAGLAAQVEDERRRLRDLVSSVPGVVWEAWGEPDASVQKIDFVSDYVEQMLGYTVEEWLGTPNFWLTIVHPEDRERAASEARAKFEGSGGVSEFRWVRKDGRAIHVASHSVPVRDAAGRPVGMRGVTMDITARKASEAELGRRVHQAALGAEVGAALAEGGVPLRRVLQLCAEAVVNHLDAAFARIWTIERGADVLELQASAGMYTHTDGPHGRVPMGQFKIGLIAAERRPHLTNAVLGDPRVGDQEWARREGMVAFAGYPLLVEDRLVGVVAMFARRALPGDTLEALASVANVIAQGIERRRAEERLAELLREREQTIEEVSTPVVPVLEGVLVLPLIGSLDTGRTARATRAALQEVTRQGARVCILDITGARMVDSHAVANLTNLVQALKLVGAEAYVTGVGAQVAQTLVRLGLDMRGLRTYRTLAQALAALLDARGRRR